MTRMTVPAEAVVAEASVFDPPDAARLSYADVTERLMAEFGPVYGLKLVSDVVRGCQTGEDGLRRLIAPESLEELARAQLNGRTTA